MSHIIEFSGQRIRNLNTLSQAISCITGLQLVLPPGAMLNDAGQACDAQGQPLTTGTMPYRNWASDHGALAGGYPLPAGVTAAQAGRNAVAVIRVTEDAPLKHRNPHTPPYEVGVIPKVDEQTGELSYTFAHDFFCGGYGLEELIGATQTDSHGKVKSAYGSLLMYYNAVSLKQTAEAAGQSFEFEMLDNGSMKVTIDAENVGVPA